MTGPGGTLLVEDDENLLNAYRLVLRSRGLELSVASTASEALRRARREAPAVVVADLGLPDVRGVELVERLCSAVPDADVLVLTGDDDAALRDACLLAGACAFLVKPVSGKELAVILQDRVEKRRSEREGEGPEDEAT